MWLNLTTDERLEILQFVSSESRIPIHAVEKDWWVTRVLEALFSSCAADSFIFKGGTSLSKGWDVIHRFSEDIDIDIGINRELLGFSGALSKNQISDKLRRASKTFVDNELKDIISQGLWQQGIDSSQFEIYTEETPISTTDPRKIYIKYKSVTDHSMAYIGKEVHVEAGARSIIDPSSSKAISSLIDLILPDQKFARPSFNAKVTPIGRTFLEKAFLLHEEFSKPKEKIRNHRMSRHMYDLEKLMDYSEAMDYLFDSEMYMNIIEHRKKFIHLQGFDYETLYPQTINLIPIDDSVLTAWENDYKSMRSEMIYGETLSFDTLIDRLKELQGRFREAAIAGLT